MRTGNILAAIAERFVAVASKPANVGRTLTLCVIPPQLREAAEVWRIELKLVALGVWFSFAGILFQEENTGAVWDRPMPFRSHARSIIAFECPPARRSPATNTGFAPPPALIFCLNLLLSTIGLALAMACFVLAATIWETRAVLAGFETGPDATVSTTPVEV
jgi:hypothetical protein